LTKWVMPRRRNSWQGRNRKDVKGWDLGEVFLITTKPKFVHKSKSERCGLRKRENLGKTAPAQSIEKEGATSVSCREEIRRGSVWTEWREDPVRKRKCHKNERRGKGRKKEEEEGKTGKMNGCQ